MTKVTFLPGLKTFKARVVDISEGSNYYIYTLAKTEGHALKIINRDYPDLIVMDVRASRSEVVW